MMRKLQLFGYSAIAFLLIGEVKIVPDTGAIGNWLNINQAAYAKGGGGGGGHSSSSGSHSAPSHSSSNSSNSASGSHSAPSRSSSSSPSRSTPVDSTRSGGSSNSNSSEKQSSPAPSSARSSDGNTGGRVRAGSFDKAPEPVNSAPVSTLEQQRSSGSTTVIRRSVQTEIYPVYTQPSLPYNPAYSQPNPSSEQQPFATPEATPPKDSASEPLSPNNPAYSPPNSSSEQQPFATPEVTSPKDSASEPLSPNNPAYSPPNPSSEQQPLATPEATSPEDSAHKWRLFWFWIFLSGGGVALLFYCICYYQCKPSNELNNDTVTVSKLQVALLADVGNIQSLLTELSLNAETGSVEGRAEFLQGCVLTLLRSPENWTHALASSETVESREKAEAIFNKLSIQKRSKVSVETLSNVNGNIRTRDFFPQSDRGSVGYIVLTFLVGTDDDSPLFGEIQSREELKAALERMATMPSKYLLIFELSWSPQESYTLSEDELVTSYSDLVQI